MSDPSEQIRVLKRELSRAQKALADRRVIDAAKCRLMERKGLSEEAAYKQLQAQAMDTRRTIVEVALALLHGRRD
jgi:two-component system, response regulator / RNA-binding antiterminator